jgi:hypothetical protein
MTKMIPSTGTKPPLLILAAGSAVVASSVKVKLSNDQRR